MRELQTKNSKQNPKQIRNGMFSIQINQLDYPRNQNHSITKILIGTTQNPNDNTRTHKKLKIDEEMNWEERIWKDIRIRNKKCKRRVCV